MITEEPLSISDKSMLKHRFNDDLLLGEKDRIVAKSKFSKIYHILDHPKLREEFIRYESMANRAKLFVQRLGMAAVVLATLALLSSALSPLLNFMKEVPQWVYSLSFYTEILGLIGSTIAVGGLWLSGWKKKWLESRLMTEALRQWHFQLLMCRSKEIELSCDPTSRKARDNFQKSRAEWFSAFMHEWEGNLDALVEELVDRPEASYKWLHEVPSDGTSKGAILDAIFAAYKDLRLKHQAHYVAYKLQRSTDKPLWRLSSWPPIVLQQRIETIASFCLIGSLLLSIFITLGHFIEWPIVRNLAISSTVILLMILNVATRAIQDGLAAPEEVQRYNEYSGKIHYLLARFEASQDDQEKLQVMEDMERAAFEELKGFLRAHARARFIL